MPFQSFQPSNTEHTQFLLDEKVCVESGRPESIVFHENIFLLNEIIIDDMPLVSPGIRLVSCISSA